jgi:protein-L-isoaspartate(D-aspartate) O-methyltransferase
MPRSQDGLARLVGREGVSDRVTEAFRAIDRADFVPHDARAEAYADRPIPIPEGQTTSQPSLIARMIDVASVQADDRVLEVGTGYGFQTALLAHLAREVVSIDRHESLAARARANLERAGVRNVTVLTGDGWQGAPEHAPFEAIVVSAAASEVPRALTDQLSDGGRLVIPVRAPMGDEVLLFVKRGGELVRDRLVTPARFVPLVPGEPGESPTDR